MAKKLKPQASGGMLLLFPYKIIVLVEGIAVGPFDTPEKALAWAYENSSEGIYQLKQLIDPRMGI